MRVVKALLALGILPLLLVGRLSWAGDLHDAAGAGDFETVKKLLDDGASVDEKTVATPLYFAAQNGHADVVALLIERGADVNGMSKFGAALHISARRGHIHIMEILLQNGADPNIKGGDRESTPLHFAALSGSIDAARVLLQNGADVNARTKHREPPIHNAKSRDYEELATLLVEHGARTTDVEPISNDLASADLKEGKLQLKLECSSCHSLEPEKNQTGPSLWNLVGREKASVPKFPYSPAMDAQQGVWSYEELNRFLADPYAVVPGMKMDYGRELDRQKRAAMIAYLRTLSDNPVPLP